MVNTAQLDDLLNSTTAQIVASALFWGMAGIIERSYANYLSLGGEEEEDIKYVTSVDEISDLLNGSGETNEPKAETETQEELQEPAETPEESYRKMRNIFTALTIVSIPIMGLTNIVFHKDSLATATYRSIASFAAWSAAFYFPDVYHRLKSAYSRLSTGLHKLLKRE